MMAFFLLACDTDPGAAPAPPTADADTDTDADADGDGDGDADTDGDTDADTGIALMWLHLAGEWDDAGWLGGQLGHVYTGLETFAGPYLGDELCRHEGQLVVTAPAPCPTCDWAWELVVENVESVGPYCDQFGPPGVEGTEISLGFTTGYGYGYETQGGCALWYYMADYGAWYPFVSGSSALTCDASSFELFHYSAAYYYYP